MPITRCSRWTPTPAHVRAVTVAAGGALASVLLGRPDLLVIASPFVAIVVWSIATRPSESPSADARLGNDTLREGESTTWSVTVHGVHGADVVACVLARRRWRDVEPASGIRLTARTQGGQHGDA